MGVKVYYSEISANKEVKKRQQRVMMILESKHVPYEAIDITEPGKESDKDYMMKNAKPRGDSKFILSPQIFNDDLYCGDYDDFDLANENDVLEKFLNTPKIESNMPASNGTQNGNAGSRENSAEAEAKSDEITIVASEEKSEPEVPSVTEQEIVQPNTSVENPTQESEIPETSNAEPEEEGGEDSEKEQ